MIPAHLATDQKNRQDSEASSRASWNTPRSDSRRGLSYASRMALSFALTSLMTVLIMICVVSVVWGGVFSEYTRSNVTEIAHLTAQKLFILLIWFGFYVKTNESVIVDRYHIVEVDSPPFAAFNLKKINLIFHMKMFGFWRSQRCIVADIMNGKYNTDKGPY